MISTVLVLDFVWLIFICVTIYAVGWVEGHRSATNKARELQQSRDLFYSNQIITDTAYYGPVKPVEPRFYDGEALNWMAAWS